MTEKYFQMLKVKTSAAGKFDLRALYPISISESIKNHVEQILGCYKLKKILLVSGLFILKIS